MVFQKSNYLRTTALCAVIAGFMGTESAHAQTALPPVAVTVAPDQTETGQPLGTSLLSKGALQSKASSVTETAQFLDGLPGVSLYSAGGFSSLPTLRGMNDDRINTLVDGVPLIAACPNHMNPILSYVQPTTVAAVEVMAGITPVSKGGDSIGGSIDVKTAPPVFAEGNSLFTQGSASTFFKSINQAWTLAANGAIANDRFSLSYAGSGTHARDYKDGNEQRVSATKYNGQNHDAKLAFKGDSFLTEVEFGLQDLTYEGFPNQFMDMLGNQSRFASGHYHGNLSWGELDARSYWRYTTHFMSFVNDRQSNMPMSTKETEAGYSLKADIPLSASSLLKVGNEFHFSLLNDWWRSADGSMMMSPNTFVNLHNATRSRVGTYVEWENKPDAQWTTLVGLRNDTVFMDTSKVQGYETTDYGADATAFNALNHQKTDINFDATLLAQYEASTINTDEIGYAHKTRSPNFYERYAWSKNAMAAEMIGWFGDGNGYVGSVDLKPEQANIFSLTTGWHDSAKKDWSVKLTPFYNYIRNYIGVNYLGSNGMMGPAGSSLLKFANHDAMTYGLEIATEKALVDSSDIGHVGIAGTSGLQRGYTINDGNSLYHLMPLTLSVALNHQLGGWSNALEVKATSSKSQSDPLRHEPFTPGFAVVNFRTAYEWRNLRLDGGIDNLLNQQYYSPLGGMDLADWKVAGGSSSVTPRPLAAPGRSYNAGVTVKF